jgi:uncharacterized protein (TIGR00369 family)
MTEGDFAPISAERRRRWMDELNGEAFALLTGLRFEEIRLDYARMRLPARAELRQGAGVVHGGMIAALLDNAAVGAVFSAHDERPKGGAATIDLHVHYLDAVADEDLVAEARVRRRGRSRVFLEVEARTDAGRVVAHAEVCYRVRS